MNEQCKLPPSSSINLPTSLFTLTALEAAPLLLGQTIVRQTEDGTIRCRIVETEAYGGALDQGSHAFGNRKTARTSVMFDAGGIAYVYLIYGMYHCLNVVTGVEGDPQAVLIRAVEPLTPADEQLMAKYRTITSRKRVDLANGPGKLCKALQINKSLNGHDLRQKNGPLYLEAAEDILDLLIVQAPRINIPYAGDYVSVPWRFYIANHPFVSVRDKAAELLNKQA